MKLSYIVNTLEDCNVKIIEVNIKPKNTGSIIFHKKFGFHQVGTQSTDKGEKEVSLMKYLITKR